MTAELAERAEVQPAEDRAPSHLRLLPIPDTEPAPDATPYVPGPEQVTPVEQPDQPLPALALVPPGPTPGPTPGQPVRFESFGPRPTPTRELPDPQRWTRQVVQAMVEVLAGVRPAAQLARWTSPDVYAGLQRRVRGHGAGRGPRTGRPAVVRSVHLCQPADGVVEACAVLVGGGRVRAIALRLEGVDGRWRVTAVQLG